MPAAARSRLLARWSMAAGLATGVLLAGAAPASAAAVTVAPAVAPPGGTVTVSGSCAPDNNTSGEAFSSVFFNDATHDFAGLGAVTFSTDPSNGHFSVVATVAGTAPAGTATVTVRCGGGLLGSATFTVGAGMPFTGQPVAPALALGGVILLAGAGLVLASRKPQGRHFAG